jgi:hypothetical protein
MFKEERDLSPDLSPACSIFNGAVLESIVSF